jgi:TetR/AcrR family transcriptional regulator, repressor for neighboring sulfatase
MNKVGQNKIAAKETAVRSNSHGEIPYGREAVKKAILDAAENLLVKKSAGEISVREIAEAANIKHPLIYRHFGTKEEVIRAAHARGIEKVEGVVTKIDRLQGNAGFIFEAVKQNRFRQIALSRAMIDGVDLRLVQTQFPVMRHLLELLEKRKEEAESDSKFDPQIMTAVLAALSLGWFLYEPFLLAATEMEEKNKDEIQQKVVDILEEIIQKLC